MNGYADNPYGQNYATGGGASGGGGGFMAGSQTDSPGGGKRGGPQNLRPVTIRQILNASSPHPDAEFMLDGLELGQLSFVAVVRNISRNATNISYSVEDGTGQIEVRQWLDSSAGEDADKGRDIEQNMYVRILGIIKSFNNRKSVSAAHIRLVEDFNEVFFHKVDAVHAHLQLTRGVGNALVKQNNGYSDMGAYSGSAPAANTTDQYKDLAPLQQRIMQVIVAETPNAPDGVHVALISRTLGVDQAQIAEAVEDLGSEGYLYTAADDDHVLATS